MLYEIEITRFEPVPTTVRTTASNPSEAEALVREGADGALYVLVACHEGEVSLGEFHVWLASGRAIVRVDEHREWHASDVAWAEAAAAGEVWLNDCDGTFFSAQVAETVSRSQAFAALGYWLRRGEKLPSLRWA
jgi:hypothetical protein